MTKREPVIRLVPRIGKPPRPYKLQKWENTIVKSLDNCPIEHSHFIAEHCRLNPVTIEMLLRYARHFSDKTIEECADEIGLENDGTWREPRRHHDKWISNLPSVAKEFRDQIYLEHSPRSESK